MSATLGLMIFAAPAGAQLTDLQPGRNFASEIHSFGGGFSESIDFGDVDNDGDLDVLVGNGGDSIPMANRIFINLGGAQGGLEGTFVDSTATLFAGIPADTTRDMEFADIDSDGDLDILSVNRGTLSGGGEVSRWYVNLGGLQGGAIAHYVEETDARWGRLVGVPPSQEVGTVDGMGPFADWSCDCDFGDLDDDGDLDLFFGSYGPIINGTTNSRVFLNDGTGVFNELWPWANHGADIQLHTLDIDLADFDGDFDLDVFASSRNSQARVYLNNHYNPISNRPFHDITQFALLDSGSAQAGTHNYDSEYGDLDGDGDFDVWALNYAGLGNGDLDRILRNDGAVPGQGFRFVAEPLWIKGDPNADEDEIDFLDHDGDGDLDAWSTNFVDHHWLYVSGLAQGLDADVQGLFHRSATTSAGSLAFWPEIGATLGGTFRDSDAGDLDGDGDPDVALARDGNQVNFYRPNTLGVPDTHAPRFQAISRQCDKPEGSASVIHAAVRDNSPHYIVRTYDCVLSFRVGARPWRRVGMVAQGGMQFRGVIPPQVGTVSYRVECTDRAGNVGLSEVHEFTQAGPVWTDVGGGAPGVSGVPMLAGTGTWESGSEGLLALSNARPSALSGLFFSTSAGPVPLAGGQLVPYPFSGPILFITSPLGTLDVAFEFPGGVPCGTEEFVQFVIEDVTALGGFSLSNSLRARTP